MTRFLTLAAAGLLAMGAFATDAHAQWGYGGGGCATGGYGNVYGGYSAPSYGYGNYGGYNYGPSYGSSYTTNRFQTGGYYNTGHYDYHAPSLYQHRGHVDVQPGHYDYHR